LQSETFDRKKSSYSQPVFWGSQGRPFFVLLSCLRYRSHRLPRGLTCAIPQDPDA